MCDCHLHDSNLYPVSPGSMQSCVAVVDYYRPGCFVVCVYAPLHTVLDFSSLYLIIFMSNNKSRGWYYETGSIMGHWPVFQRVHFKSINF